MNNDVNNSAQFGRPYFQSIRENEAIEMKNEQIELVEEAATSSQAAAEFSGNLEENLLTLSEMNDPRDELLEYTRFLLSQTGNYIQVENAEKEAFKQFINTENNAEALQKRLISQVGMLKELRGKEPTDLLTNEEIIQIANRVKESFFINLEEAFSRQKEHFGIICQIASKSNLYEPRLEKIEVLQGSDPHHGGKQACLLCYSDRNHDTVQIVYKPRDLRAEASIVNDKTNVFNSEKSAFSILNELLGEKILPTYRIETCQDNRGHFGFVQFISQTFSIRGSTPEERAAHDKIMQRNGLNEKEEDQFYRRVGALQFAAQLLGITDLNASNLIVAGNHKEGYYMYPIDLEASYDVRVLIGGYTTGLKDGLSGRGGVDSNFIVMKKGISPRGHRYSPKDIESLRLGFVQVKAKLSSTKAINRLLDFAKIVETIEHRYVPIPTGDLKKLIEDGFTLERSAENLFTLMEEKLSKDQLQVYRTSLQPVISGEAYTIKEELAKDKLYQDIPLFIIHNGTGTVTLNGKEITILPSPYIEFVNKIAQINKMKIEGLILQKEP